MSFQNIRQDDSSLIQGHIKRSSALSNFQEIDIHKFNQKCHNQSIDNADDVHSISMYSRKSHKKQDSFVAQKSLGKDKDKFNLKDAIEQNCQEDDGSYSSEQINMQNSQYRGQQSVSRFNSPKRKPTFTNRQSIKQKDIRWGKLHITKFFSIIWFISRFLNKVQAPYKRRREINKLQSTHYKLIDDQACFFDYEDQTKVGTENQEYSAITLILHKILSLKLTILPNSRFKIICDCYQSALIVYRMFLTTVKLSYFITNPRDSLDLMNNVQLAVINISFIYDIILTCNTGFYEKGVIVTSQKRIIKNYVDNGLIQDILAQIPLIVNYFATKDSSEVMILIAFLSEFLIFFKQNSLSTTFTRLERALTENDSIADWFPLVILVMRIIITAHIVGLLYHLMAVVEIELMDSEKTWLHTQNLIDSSWIDKYIHSFYWAVSTMVTILLYLPLTNEETLFAVVAIFFMTGVFGYALNTIGMILQDLDKKTKQQKLEKQLINRFLRNKKIKEDMKERVQQYVDYLHESEKNRNLEEEEQVGLLWFILYQVLNRLSPHLRSEILQEMYSKVLEDFPFIKNNFSNQTVNNIILAVKEEMFSPGATIFEEGQQENSLYLIQKGQIELLIKDSSVYGTLSEHDSFGYMEFFSGQVRSYMAKAKTSSTVYKIHYEDFQDIVKKNQDDFEIYCQIKDEFLFYNSSSSVVGCNLCSSTQHIPKFCPTIQFIADKKQIIYDYNNLGAQLRQRWDRADVRTCDALLSQQVIQLRCQEIEYDPEFLEIVESFREFFRDSETVSMIEESFLQDQEFMRKHHILTPEQKNEKKNILHKEQIVSEASHSDYMESEDHVDLKHEPKTEKLVPAVQGTVLTYSYEQSSNINPEFHEEAQNPPSNRNIKMPSQHDSVQPQSRRSSRLPSLSIINNQQGNHTENRKLSGFKEDGRLQSLIQEKKQHDRRKSKQLSITGLKQPPPQQMGIDGLQKRRVSIQKLNLMNNLTKLNSGGAPKQIQGLDQIQEEFDPVNYRKNSHLIDIQHRMNSTEAFLLEDPYKNNYGNQMRNNMSKSNSKQGTQVQSAHHHHSHYKHKHIDQEGHEDEEIWGVANFDRLMIYKIYKYEYNITNTKLLDKINKLYNEKYGNQILKKKGEEDEDAEEERDMISMANRMTISKQKGLPNKSPSSTKRLKNQMSRGSSIIPGKSPLAPGSARFQARLSSQHQQAEKPPSSSAIPFKLDQNPDENEQL